MHFHGGNKKVLINIEINDRLSIQSGVRVNHMTPRFG